jgi:PAS domain S-box-containing protein
MASSEKRPENGEWEAVFNAIGAAIWVLDPEFRIRRANKAAEALFHLSSNQMAGKHCWEIVRETARSNSQCLPCLPVRQKTGNRSECNSAAMV